MTPFEEALWPLSETPGAFVVSFTAGSCSQFPASYSQTLTLEVNDSHTEMTLRQAQHVDTGTINHANQTVLLRSPGVEEYDITISVDSNGRLSFTGTYKFTDGANECTWMVSGTASG